jgi:hypothetical protein
VPTAKIVEIATSLVTRLNDGSFSQEFTAERTYDPAVNLAALDDLKVTVVIKDSAGTPLTRNLMENTHSVDIAVRKRVDPAVLPEVDALILLCEEITDDLLGTPILSGAGVQIVSVGIVAVYSPEAIRDKRAFLSVLTVTFRETRTRGG